MQQAKVTTLSSKSKNPLWLDCTQIEFVEAPWAHKPDPRFSPTKRDWFERWFKFGWNDNYVLLLSSIFFYKSLSVPISNYMMVALCSERVINGCSWRCNISTHKGVCEKLKWLKSVWCGKSWHISVTRLEWRQHVRQVKLVAYLTTCYLGYHNKAHIATLLFGKGVMIG